MKLYQNSPHPIGLTQKFDQPRRSTKYRLRKFGQKKPTLPFAIARAMNRAFASNCRQRKGRQVALATTLRKRLVSLRRRCRRPSRKGLRLLHSKKHLVWGRVRKEDSSTMGRAWNARLFCDSHHPFSKNRFNFGSYG